MMPTWILYALLGAASAGLVSVLAKRGMEGISPTLATAVRSVVMTLFLLAVVTTQNLWPTLRTLHARAIWLITFSGLAGALSWLFMFKALSLAPVSKVAPLDKLSMPIGIVLAVLILGERPTWINWTGIVLMSAGAYLATWSTR